MDNLAAKIIQEQTSLTGVQPKLSLHLDRHEGSSRLTIVGLWGQYIFKPQTAAFRELPEVEDLTMHLARLAGIKTVSHSLIRLTDGSLGYITRRIDRAEDGSKIAMEDMCQLSGNQTEFKYRSSYEKIAKAIAKYSSIPRLDMTEYFRLLLFCYLTGNNDMHLKNFSLYIPDGVHPRLTPAYDLLNAAIVNPADSEELALTLNGKKKNIKLQDFEAAALKAGVPAKLLVSTLKSWEMSLPDWFACIDASFVSEDLKESYKKLIEVRLTAVHKQ